MEIMSVDDTVMIEDPAKCTQKLEMAIVDWSFPSFVKQITQYSDSQKIDLLAHQRES